MPSRTRPLLIDDLGRRIAQVGRLPYAGSIRYVNGGPEPRQNSAQRLHALWGALALTESVRGPIARARGPVLLVDDRIETGWTMTVAAKLLREAGVPAVLPLALAVTGG
jgi:ATP-dependent DNA helicase RecQ